MTEFASLQRALDAVQEDLRAQARHRTDQNTLLAQQNEALAEVKAKLPAFASRRQLGLTIFVLILVLLLAVLVMAQFRAQDEREAKDRERHELERQLDQEAAARFSEEAILINSCSLKGLLEQAISSSIRNPIPPGLDPAIQAFVEQSRATAKAFYEQQLASINVTLGRLGNPTCPSPTNGSGG